MGASDVSMGAGAQGGTGYGRVHTPATNPMIYASSIPSVQAATMGYNTGLNTANTNFANQTGQLIEQYGDPTAFLSPGTVASSTPYNPNAYVPGGSSPAQAAAIQARGYGTPGGNPVGVPGGPISLAQALGLNSVDPQVAAIARANTMSPTGAIGQSIVAQLYLAAQNARDAAVTSGIGSGFSNSSQLGTNVNAANINANQANFDAASKLKAQIEGLSEKRVSTINKLQDRVNTAYSTVIPTVTRNPDLYHVDKATTRNVGGTVGLAKNQPVSNEIIRNAILRRSRRIYG